MKHISVSCEPRNGGNPREEAGHVKLTARKPARKAKRKVSRRKVARGSL